MGDLPSYQAGFLHNRSTDDHIFTMRRVCEERWRKGLPTFILSIDLRKAFDMVNTHRLGIILHSLSVPSFLIDRIVVSILHERTSIQFGGQRTGIHERTKGVKQGCPISPYLFVVVLDYVMQRVSCRTGIDLNLQTFQVPFLLAYADDILIVGDSIMSLENVFAILEEELLLIGLEINDKKCCILVRDPVQHFPPFGDTITLNQKVIKRAHVLKYLGIYISSDLDRKGTVSSRVKAAYRAFHMLLPFMQANRLPMSTLLRIYHTVIIPSALFGLKVATLTKKNRQSLRNMESHIISRLRLLARDRPVSVDPFVLLRGRTIIRKVRVHRLKYWGHINRRPAYHILRRAMNYSIPGTTLITFILSFICCLLKIHPVNRKIQGRPSLFHLEHYPKPGPEPNTGSRLAYHHQQHQRS